MKKYYKKAKLSLHMKTVPELFGQARHIVESMIDNANFSNPVPPLISIKTLADKLETIYEDAKDGTHTKIAEKQKMAVELKHLLTALAGYVDSIASGDAEIIFSAGMDVNKDPEPAGVLAAPADLRIERADNEGEILVRFKKVISTRIYEIEYYDAIPYLSLPKKRLPSQTETAISLGLNFSDIKWEKAGKTSKTKFVFKSLNLGNWVLVRVKALNCDGKGIWSEPVAMIVT